VKGLPFRRLGDDITLNLLGEHDTPWISRVLDEVEATVGLASRELADRMSRLEVRTAPARRHAVMAGMRRWLGRRNGRGMLASRVRQRVLGPPALTAGERERRITEAALALELTPPELEEALWSDLPSERTVTMPRGRPGELAVAAAANAEILKTALRRTHRVRIEVWGNARPVFRAAALQGLLATASARGERSLLEISGPLALFHRTTVYGRAMGALVGALAWCERFTLELRLDVGLVRVSSPVLLPAPPPPRRYDSVLEARFARDFARHVPAWRAIREPAAVAAGDHLLFPDFVLEHRDDPRRRWWLEILGFWTADYLAHKLARYREAELPNVILCLDADRAVSPDELPADARIVRFHRRIDVEHVLGLIKE
jgi:predicted nuclease of restriction endonuclease-like RecB superfamily